jgi:hypothetical protein
MADDIHHPTTNAISGPGMWLHTPENIASMTVLPSLVTSAEPTLVIKLEISAGHEITLKVATT